ncbi:Short-chain dehydrogenase/reductase tropE [Lachnellula suecica]|uniref:Short-chain dehydrogenase/reductase tropE n=1 Tax=Lachnellula suecica TaxID=602035 RepID=A0A8T9CE60_9HELO|nr:Short-chain dehydrogenase/reductase tropE [Lachnellula suecica]
MTAAHVKVLITGSNQGIGFETAKNLLRNSSKYHVIIGSRNPAKGEEAINALKALPDITGTCEFVQLDVTDDKSVDDAAVKIGKEHGYLDILVNNAGIYDRNPTPREALRAILAVNVVGVVSVTEAFLPLLRKSKEPRLIFVGSSVGSISQAADPNSKYYAPMANEYRCSKAAVNMLMTQYWVKLGKDVFKVFGADPGLVATNFVDPDVTRKRGAAEPEIGGERIATVVRGNRDADVGRVCGEYGISPW